jgi:hypothetical protein
VSMTNPRRHEAAAPVVAKFRAEGYEPEGFTLYGYAVVQAWAQVVEKTGSFDDDAVVDALRCNEFDTVLGRLGFDDKGDVTGIHSFIWYVWSDTGYHPADKRVGDKGSATATPPWFCIARASVCSFKSPVRSVVVANRVAAKEYQLRAGGRPDCEEILSE